MLSPGTLDFDTFEKLGEYKTVETLDHIVFVEPDAAEIAHWTRMVDRHWERRIVEGLDGVLEISTLGVSLKLVEIYDGVAFPGRLRPRLVEEQ